MLSVKNLLTDLMFVEENVVQEIVDIATKISAAPFQDSHEY